MKLKSRIVVQNSVGNISIWRTKNFDQRANKDYKILATFNEHEPLDESDTPTQGLTDIEREAARQWPDVDESTDYASDDYRINEVRKFQRAAHISCAKQFLDKVKALEAERDKLRKALEIIRDTKSFTDPDGFVRNLAIETLKRKEDESGL